MKPIPRLHAGLALALCMGSFAEAQVKISDLPAAPPSNGSAAAPVGQGGARDKGDQAWRQGLPAAPQTISLLKFYQALGTVPCASAAVDQAAETAAYHYMVAHGGAYIEIPPGFCYQTTTGLLIANRSGWIATPGTVMITQARGGAASATTATISLDSVYDTNWVISGLILNGGWRYGRSPYSRSPNADPWIDTEHAIVINNAFAGAADAIYTANNPTGQGWPGGTIQNVRVVNYGGDCYAITGAGGGFYSLLSAFTCGGHGLTTNQYDSHFYMLDLGYTGRSGLYLGGAASDDQFTGKIWFAGFRGVSGDQNSINAQPYASHNVWEGDLQDSFCDAIMDAGGANQFRGSVNWVGQTNAHLCSNLSVYKDALGVVAPRVDLSVSSNAATWPNVTYLLNDAGGALAQGSFTFTEAGMPTSANFGASWLTGTIGFNNLVTVDGSTRAPRAWLPGPNFNATATVVPFAITDSVTRGPIGVTLAASTNYRDDTVGSGGYCLQSSTFGPCWIAVDPRGKFTLDIGGKDQALGTAAAANTGTSGANVPLLNGANAWSGVQGFAASGLTLLGSSSGKTTFASANASATNYTLTAPAATDTLATLKATQTLTNKTLTAPLISVATWADNQACTAGQIAVDANYVYVCTAANTVKRAALRAF